LVKFILLAGIIGVFGFCQPQQQNATAKSVTPATYQDQVKPGDLLVDVRTPSEYNAGHVENAILSDFSGGQFAEQMKNWDKDKTYYLYCATGNRSGKAAKLMTEAGFTKVYNLDGYSDLKSAELPTTKE